MACSSATNISGTSAGIAHIKGSACLRPCMHCWYGSVAENPANDLSRISIYSKPFWTVERASSVRCCFPRKMGVAYDSQGAQGNEADEGMYEVAVRLYLYKPGAADSKEQTCILSLHPCISTFQWGYLMYPSNHRHHLSHSRYHRALHDCTLLYRHHQGHLRDSSRVSFSTSLANSVTPLPISA